MVLNAVLEMLFGRKAESYIFREGCYLIHSARDKKLFISEVNWDAAVFSTRLMWKGGGDSEN